MRQRESDLRLLVRWRKLRLLCWSRLPLLQERPRSCPSKSCCVCLFVCLLFFSVDTTSRPEGQIARQEQFAPREQKQTAPREPKQKAPWEHNLSALTEQKQMAPWEQKQTAPTEPKQTALDGAKADGSEGARAVGSEGAKAAGSDGAEKQPSPSEQQRRASRVREIPVVSTSVGVSSLIPASRLPF